MINAYILCGGPSSEHDIALRSALNIMNNLNKDKYKVKLVYIDRKGAFSDSFDPFLTDDEFDLIKETSSNKALSISKFLKEVSNLDRDKTIIIPVIHGTYGEDGTIQGFLDACGLSYIGNGLLSSAICMDKVTSNDIFEKNKLKQAKYLYTNKENFDEDFAQRCIDTIGLPLIVKPSANGSSVGVSRVDNKKDLDEAIELALSFDRKVLVEELIEGQEIEFAVIGDRDPSVSDPAAYITDHTFLDYDAKYFSKSTKESIPFILDEDKLSYAKDFAKKCYIACGCQGFARVDIFYGRDNNFYINEINTFPGFTKSSFFARLCELMYGLDFSKVLDILIEDGLKGRDND